MSLSNINVARVTDYGINLQSDPQDQSTSPSPKVESNQTTAHAQNEDNAKRDFVPMLLNSLQALQKIIFHRLSFISSHPLISVKKR